MSAQSFPEAGDLAFVVDNARDNVETVEVGGDTLVVAHRADVNLTAYDLREIEDRYADRPRRAAGTVQAHSAHGFVSAVQAREESAEVNQPTVYIDKPARKLTCVLDDIGNDGAGHRGHRVVFEPIRTDEWAHWMNHQGMHAQDEFADIIETGEAELHQPSAAVMLDVAQTFAANVSVRARSASRIRDGQVQFAWEEDIEATAGADGATSIPAEFTIRVRPFYGSAAVEVRCRLRFRLRDGKLSIGYHLVRPEDVERAAFDTVVDEAIDGLVDDEGLTRFPIIHGRA